MSYPKLTPIVADGAETPRYLGERFAAAMTPLDFGAKGDGTTDDSEAFDSLETSTTGKLVDLCGLTYLVEERPAGNYYVNGYFKVNGTTIPASHTAGCNILIGWRPGESYSFLDSNTWLEYFISNGVTTPEEIVNSYNTTGTTDGLARVKGGVIAIGARSLFKALRNKTYLNDCIAIGSEIMSDNNLTSDAQHNVAIGNSALHMLTSGTRNIAIGSLAHFANTSGTRNVVIGRDSCHCLTTGSHCVAIGYGSFSGLAPITPDGKITPLVNNTVSGATVVGCYAAGGFCNTNDSYNIVAVGYNAARNIKKFQRSVFIGTNVCQNLDKNVSANHNALVVADASATYISSENIVIVTEANHSAVVGCYVHILFTSAVLQNSDSQVMYVTETTSTTFTLTHNYGEFNGSGNCTVKEYEQSESSSNSNYAATIVGSDTGVDAAYISGATVIGSSTCSKENLNLINAVVIGDRSSTSAARIDCSVVIGTSSGVKGTQDKFNVLVGYCAGNVMTGTDNSSTRANVAIGAFALDHMQDGSSTVSALKNSVGIGSNSRVSGSNQVQLGNSDTTVYAYGSVQNRSDMRDKADIRDTILGLDFIKSLRPVDFKWDMRDDYFTQEEYEDTTVDEDGRENKQIKLRLTPIPKDGSKKRNRYHHGLIAQEVKAVMDEQGVDFGGYQDHKINGGNDVLSIGYEELIAPIIKSIQQIDARLRVLEA